MFFATIKLHKLPLPYNEGPCVLSRESSENGRSRVANHAVHRVGGRPWGGVEPRAPRGSNGPQNSSPREWGSTRSSLVGSSGRGVWVPCTDGASLCPWCNGC